MLRKLSPSGPLVPLKPGEAPPASLSDERRAALQRILRSGPPTIEPEPLLPAPVVAPPLVVLPPSGPTPFTLLDATDLLRAKTLELLQAGPARVSQLTIEIQKLRIICMVLREGENGVSDPNTYKELSLMNKMLTGKDLESEAERQQTLEEETAATAALQSRGIKAESASRILRALTSVLEAKEAPDDDDEDDDEAQSSNPAR